MSARRCSPIAWPAGAPQVATAGLILVGAAVLASVSLVVRAIRESR